MFVCAPCQVTLTLSSFYGLPSTKGGGLYEGAELDSVTIKALGTTELNLKDLSTMVQTKASSKVDQVQLLVSHAHRSDARTIEHGTEDMYIQVHLPDGGTTMIKLPATTSMGEMLYHIADKRSLEIGSFEMAAKKNGKKMLSLQGTIGQNNVKEVFCLKKKGYKAKSLDSLSSTSSLMRTSSADVDSSVQKLTSLLAEGVSFDDPRIPAIWTQFITTANITEAVMRDPGQRQQVFNIVENHGGVRNIVEMPPAEITSLFSHVLDFRKQKTAMENAVAPPVGVLDRAFSRQASAGAPDEGGQRRKMAPAPPQLKRAQENKPALLPQPQPPQRRRSSLAGKIDLAGMVSPGSKSLADDPADSPAPVAQDAGDGPATMLENTEAAGPTHDDTSEPRTPSRRQAPLPRSRPDAYPIATAPATQATVELYENTKILPPKMPAVKPRSAAPKANVPPVILPRRNSFDFLPKPTVRPRGIPPTTTTTTATPASTVETDQAPSIPQRVTPQETSSSVLPSSTPPAKPMRRNKSDNYSDNRSTLKVLESVTAPTLAPPVAPVRTKSITSELKETLASMTPPVLQEDEAPALPESPALNKGPSILSPVPYCLSASKAPAALGFKIDAELQSKLALRANEEGSAAATASDHTPEPCATGSPEAALPFSVDAPASPMRLAAVVSSPLQPSVLSPAFTAVVDDDDDDDEDDDDDDDELLQSTTTSPALACTPPVALVTTTQDAGSDSDDAPPPPPPGQPSTSNVRWFGRSASGSKLKSPRATALLRTPPASPSKEDRPVVPSVAEVLASPKALAVTSPATPTDIVPTPPKDPASTLPQPPTLSPAPTATSPKSAVTATPPSPPAALAKSPVDATPPPPPTCFPDSSVLVASVLPPPLDIPADVTGTASNESLLPPPVDSPSPHRVSPVPPPPLHELLTSPTSESSDMPLLALDVPSPPQHDAGDAPLTPTRRQRSLASLVDPSPAHSATLTTQSSFYDLPAPAMSPEGEWNFELETLPPPPVTPTASPRRRGSVSSLSGLPTPPTSARDIEPRGHATMDSSSDDCASPPPPPGPPPPPAILMGTFAELPRAAIQPDTGEDTQERRNSVFSSIATAR